MKAIIIAVVILAILSAAAGYFVLANKTADSSTDNSIDLPAPETDTLTVGAETYHFVCNKNSDCVPVTVRYEDVAGPICANISSKNEAWTSLPVTCICKANKCVARVS